MILLGPSVGIWRLTCARACALTGEAVRIGPIGGIIHSSGLNDHNTMSTPESNFYTLKVEMADDKVYDLADLKGKTVLIVNVASKWYGSCKSPQCVVWQLQVLSSVASLHNMRVWIAGTILLYLHSISFVPRSSKSL